MEPFTGRALCLDERACKVGGVLYRSTYDAMCGLTGAAPSRCQEAMTLNAFWERNVLCSYIELRRLLAARRPSGQKNPYDR